MRDEFGDGRARPRVIAVYASARTGWQRARRHTVLTMSEAERLRRAGVRLVKVRWHMRWRELSLEALLPPPLPMRFRSTFIPLSASSR